MKSIIALILVIICTTCNIVAYWPQFVQLIKTKSADDINLYSWIIWITSEVSYLAYILLETPEAGLILLQGSILTMSVIMFTLTKYYQNRKKAKQHRVK
ncbi:MAG: PQ-loop repeat-containing protein [Alphaproteobacteria bacterium]|nr:PQ-loop repeat-containing protein [Alphaproteobacteria bacterium]